ncbi:hypothetical protein OC846_000540 [Tilletia horrida]|uniref:Yeast cell wall synthesis Kre9/Knh1-like N-terminal domain-containing protein n=1 Tax=Tilletia horrida TaxID=155126 RepID=A0AAN6GVG6_9BASI|nr:hypothetical protein OC845_000597 [Tilletia horrida]KAK0557321.1 hypothetical protein OC846_000540 [Tilletia horrida]KAK0569629.1 hypothetical protein OC861_000711 [Tilletia horrida]
MQVSFSLAAVLLSVATSALASSHHGLAPAPLAHRSLVKRAATAAGVVPTAPGPGDVFKVGSNIPIQWDADTSGSTKWKQTTIRLMTGSNFQMSELEVVAVIDGTDSTNTTLSWPAPAVDPYSAIYFFQFDHGGDAQKDPTWTTRFAIADANGQTTTPPNATQPGSNDAIPWGTGRLASSSSTGNGSSSSSTDSAPVSTAASSTTETAASTTSSSTTAAAKTSTASSNQSGAASPPLLARPIGMALTGAGVGLAAAFIL